jgi:hypothetical protein
MRSAFRFLPVFIILAFFIIVLSPCLFADELGELIFSDNFERTESQEEVDEPGNGWGTNSKSRAKGEKQVDLREGAMVIFLSPVADHAVSVTHAAEFTDGAVQLRFKLEGDKDSLGLNFADLDYKPVHAGHLFMAKISPKAVNLTDLKTGGMDLVIREARTAGTLTPEQKKLLASKDKKILHELELGRWYDLLVVVSGSSMTLSIDGSEVGTFTSEGLAHPTKKTLRLSVPGKATVDDVKIWRKN